MVAPLLPQMYAYSDQEVAYFLIPFELPHQQQRKAAPFPIPMTVRMGVTGTGALTIMAPVRE